MTHDHHRAYRRRLDVPSLLLLLLGIICGVISYALVTDRDANPLVLVPSSVIATIGAVHLIKREITRH